MALESDKSKRIFFSYKETTANTPNTTCFFEGRGAKMAFPEPEYQLESDKNKMGSGEHGKKAELQALWVPWSYTCERLSEVAYFMSYFQGKSYTVVSHGTPQVHEIYHLLDTERTLPTFTMEYGTGGTGNNKVITGCIVNEFSISFTNGGNGKVEATFSGFGNRHKKVASVFTEHDAGNMETGAFDFSSEPLLNYKCLNVWYANTMLDVDANSVSFGGEDLGTGLTNITTLINSITMGGSNGFAAADHARAGGCGILNDYVRGDRTYSLEINIRKDDSSINTDTLILANTQRALEIQYAGKMIDGNNHYAVDFFYPVVQLMSAPEDTSNPINKNIPFEIFQDSNKDAFLMFAQSAVTAAYNS